MGNNATGGSLFFQEELCGKDADLLYLSKQPKTCKQCRPIKYEGKVDVKNLNYKHLQSVENNKNLKTYSRIVYSRSLGRNILLIVEEFRIKDKTIHRLLFSTDIEQAPMDVIDIYHTRFQIEFGGRMPNNLQG